MFADWEEIFGKDRATGEFAEGPEDAVEEIERTEAQKVANNMSLGFFVFAVDEDDVPATREDQTAQEEPNVSLEQHKVPLLLKMNLIYQLEQNKVHSQLKMMEPNKLRNKIIILKHHLLKPMKKVDARKEKQQLRKRMKLFLKV